MWQLFNSDLELVVESGFIYLPLLFDPEIEKETQKLFHSERSKENFRQPESKTIIKLNGRYFVKALSTLSLLENSEKINPYDYKRLRSSFLRKYHLTPEVDGIFLDETLSTILFKIMPYFVRKNKGMQRKSLSDEEMLDLIGKKISIPEKYYEEAKRFRDLEPLQEILMDLKDQKSMLKPPGNGLLSGRKLRYWFHEAILKKVMAREHNRIAEALQVREQFSQAKQEHIAILLYIADKGSLEIDGFGFIKNNDYLGEYLVYKRTGEYVLKDYYARRYSFPDCRVAVSTYTPFWPFVMEKYKHPFLLRHKSGQEICMKGYKPTNQMTAKNVIRIIDEGITALLYGYDARKRNGYHSLERRWVHIPTIDFEDYRI